MGDKNTLLGKKIIINNQLTSDEKPPELSEIYKLILDNSSDVIWIIDIDTAKVTFITPSVLKLTGYSTEEVIDKGFKQLLLPESLKKELDFYYTLHKKIKKNESVPTSNERFDLRGKDGNIINVETSINIIYNTKGVPVEILGITRDITSRINIEKSLAESQKKLETLLEKQTLRYNQLATKLQYIFKSATNAVGFFDINGDDISFSTCNERWAHALGKDPMELEGLNINELEDKETAALYKEYILKAVDQKKPIEDSIYWHNMHLYAIIIPIENEFSDEITSCGALIYNISDKIEARKTIDESDARFMSIFNNSKDAIALLTMDLEIIEANESLFKLHGAKEIMTKNIIQFHVPPQYHRTFFDMHKCVNKGISIPTFECELYRYNKSLVPVEISTSLITLKGEQMLLCFIRDISEQKELERKMNKIGTQVENRERQKLSADLHDNVGPLLSSMNMYLSFLSRKDDLQPYAETFGDIRRILKDAISSIREISNNLNPQILQQFGLTSALEHFFETKKKLIHIELNNPIGDKRYDETVESTIYNITKEVFNNSLKYSCGTCFSMKIQDQDNRMIIEYSDNGIGFDFDEKMKNSQKSMGLFSIINRIKILNGNYTVKTSAGNGFLLKIDFPVK